MKQGLTSVALDLDIRATSASGSDEDVSMWGRMMASLEEVSKSFHEFVNTGHLGTINVNDEAVESLLLQLPGPDPQQPLDLS